MTVSISERIHKYAASLNKTWKHDRSKTVGASEIGACARRTWFSKRLVVRDDGSVDSWGPRVRGQVIEDAFWLPALQATLKEGESLIYAGEFQHTFARGYLSATSDGLLVFADGTCINLDCKSIDPRADISKEKDAHHFQVQAQMGLIRECTGFMPEVTILTYIDASFWDRIAEFEVRFSERAYTQAHARATQIMTARNALDLPPEGKMAGGDECRLCPWASHCADITVAGVPRENSDLGRNAVEHLKALCNEVVSLAASKVDAEVHYASAIERVKAFLRDNNSRGYKGDGWSVTYSTVKGRLNIDVEALIAAGVDVSQYQKEGKPSERLTVR